MAAADKENQSNTDSSAASQGVELAEINPSSDSNTQDVSNTDVLPKHEKPQIPTITIPDPDAVKRDTEAIGGATDLPTPLIHGPRDASAVGPTIQFVLLLASSTGTRHAYQIDERYLTKRGVEAIGPDGEFDPTMLTVWTLKELILRDWRDDWETKPNSPSAIRLISFGQLLGDNATLKECKIVANGEPKVLHLTVKPHNHVEKKELGAGKGHDSEDGSIRNRACCCVIL